MHDSYWTHAATVEPMSEMIRDMFIKLHSGDVIGELRDEFLDRYGEHRIPVVKAQRIQDSATLRRAKDAERRKAMAGVLGMDEGSGSSDSLDAALAAQGDVEGTSGGLEEVVNGGAGSGEGKVSAVESAFSSSPNVVEDASENGDESVPPSASTPRKLGGIELTNADLLALAHGGRLMFIGAARGFVTRIDLRKVMRKQLRVGGSLLRPRPPAFKAAVAAALEARVWPHVRSGRIKPMLDRSFALEDAAQAIRCLEERRHIGKIALAVAEG